MNVVTHPSKGIQERSLGKKVWLPDIGVTHLQANDPEGKKLLIRGEESNKEADRKHTSVECNKTHSS